MHGTAAPAFLRIWLFLTVLQASVSFARYLSEDAQGKGAHRQHPVRNARERSMATADEVRRLLSQVAKDLKPWKESGITLEMVERAYCSEDGGEGMRIQIIEGQVYIVPPATLFQTRARAAQLQIASLAERQKLPDVDFMLYTADVCYPDDLPHKSYDGNYDRCPHMGPLISTDKLKNEKCVLAPDFTFGGWPEAFLPAWLQTWALMAAAAEHNPWETRSDTLFWKGAATSKERSVVAKSKSIIESPDTNINLIDWDGDRKDFAAEFVSLPQHCHHKYLLHMAGFTYSSRLKYLLACGSAVIFPKGEHMHQEFWYHMLDDSNHITIPRLTEENQAAPLLEAFQELRNDPQRSRRIAEAGERLIKEVLHPDNVDRYWLELLSQYHMLQKFEVKQHPDAVPIETVVLRPDLHLPSEQRTCKVC